ncbi:MAG: hypothetical protein GY817_00400 [bacterium]|nr:hypothetical protein [bacterium]
MNIIIFFILSTLYSKFFGNIYIHFVLDDKIGVKFIRDRGDFICKIGCNNEWFFIEDVFFVIGKTYKVEKLKFTHMLESTSNIILENLNYILEVFNKKNYKKTKDKVNSLEEKRSIKWD